MGWVGSKQSPPAQYTLRLCSPPAGPRLTLLGLFLGADAVLALLPRTFYTPERGRRSDWTGLRP